MILKLFRITIGTFLTLLVISSCTGTSEKKPNILFILMDDLGYGQFGIYNDTITTEDFNPFFVHLVDSLQGYSLEKSLEFSKTAIPNLTSLAKEGIMFTNAHTTSNVCSPSRLGIATATLQNKWGVYTNNDSEQSGILPGTHLAENLKSLNYKTAHIGKWHIGKRNDNILNDILKKYGLEGDTNFYLLQNSHPEAYKEIKEQGYIGSVVDEQNPLNNGFDYYFGYNHWGSQYYNSYNVWENYEHACKQEGYNTDVFTDKALDVMSSSIDDSKPFYVQLHYHAVHDSVELKAPDQYYNKFNSDSYELNNFYAHIYAVDYNIKRIIEFLKSKGEYENTILVFTSDNGAMCGGSYDGHKSGSPLPGNTPFSGHKGNYYQGGFRVPMFIHWPNGIKEHIITDELVSTMDILPTVIDAAGGEISDSVDGKSLLSLFSSDDSENIHDHLIWSGIHAARWGYLIANSTKTHSTEEEFAPPAWVVIRDDYLLRYTGAVDAGIYYDNIKGRDAILELFNTKTDPAELLNIADQHPDIVQEMAKLYFEESKDFPEPVDWDKSNWVELRDQSILK